MLPLGTGVHAVRAFDYHQDEIADTPSLSSSIAHLLIHATPRHAWTAHPRLNPDWQPDERNVFDRGDAAHQVILEGDWSNIATVDAKDWRTKDAANQRDLARERGQTPLLAHQVECVRDMVNAVRDQLAHHDATPPLFTAGKPEQTIVWEEPGGVVCRARVDWLRDDLAAVDDLKTTAKSAHPDAYSRALFGVGGDVQVAFYLRGIHALTGAVPAWRWVVVENTPPYALSVISPGPDVLELGRRKVDRAIALWRECLERDEWPAYPTRVTYANVPAYEEARWLEREAEEQVAA